MSKTIVANIEIRSTPIANRANAYHFHLKNLNDFLLPRSEERFEKMIGEREVYEAFDHTSQSIVGICYITKDLELCKKSSRAEFGGVFVHEDYRKSDLPFALASFAISKFSLDNMTDIGRLIAHVHQYNKSPLKLMKRLGFKCSGAEIPPLEYVKDMKKNSDGYVIGFLFVFWKKFYVDMGHFFKTLERQQFEIRLKDGSFAKVKFDFYEGTEWGKFTQSVKSLSKKSSYKFIHNCKPCLKNSAVAWIKTFLT